MTKLNNYKTIESGAPSSMTEIGRDIIINNCKITLRFLPESNGEAINTVKKILTSSYFQEI